MNENSDGLSRRTMMKGIAWSVPVIAAATASPAYAASGGGIPGPFDASSVNISNQTVSLSGLYVPCASGSGNTAPWVGDSFTATITISYDGSNPAFSLTPATSAAPWVIISQSPTELVLQTTTTVNSCGEGSGNFLPIFVTFNAANVDPGPNSLTISGSAVDNDQPYTATPLVDMTPCSPTFGQAPVGPRDIPSPCTA